jgi:hypothetical protein
MEAELMIASVAKDSAGGGAGGPLVRRQRDRAVSKQGAYFLPGGIRALGSSTVVATRIKDDAKAMGPTCQRSFRG